MKHAAVTLDDKYALDSERFYLTGTQALVRLPMLQRQLDLAAGLNTAGYVSGYRGSPLGQVDIQMWQARQALGASHIKFPPRVHAGRATPGIRGTQRRQLPPGAKDAGGFAPPV